jgi:hypothetical protein
MVCVIWTTGTFIPNALRHPAFLVSYEIGFCNVRSDRQPADALSGRRDEGCVASSTVTPIRQRQARNSEDPSSGIFSYRGRGGYRHAN